MCKLSFDKSINKFELIISKMSAVDKKNNLQFRIVCRQVFQKSFSEYHSKTTLKNGAKLLGVGIGAAIKNARGKHVQKNFAKSSKKTNYQNHSIDYSDMSKVYEFIRTSEFSLVVKLLKIQHNYGLSEAISSISE